MGIPLPQNPGIGGIDELTSSEEAVVQNIAGLGDPNADRILFWDDSAGAFAYLTAGSGLTITDTTITATGTVDGSGTTDELTYWVDSNTLGALAVATYPSKAEIAFVKGVTSAIQTQLNAKQASDATLTALAALADGAGVLTNDGAGNLSWAAAGSSANTALSNLASVAINTTLVSDTDNTDALGTLSIAWSDLFLGNGAVINFTSSAGVSDVTITHSSNLLTLGGGDLALGTNNITMTGSLGATGARLTKVWTTDLEVTNDITIGGTALATTYLAKAGGTMSGNITLGENTSIALDPAGSADGKYSGVTISGTAGAALAFGEVCYLAAADSRWELADADAATTADRMLGICVLAAAADGNATVMLLMGTIRADTKFPALTIGSPVYVGETAGAIQVAIPTGADNVIRRVGFALTADEIYFNPSQDSQTTVA